MLGAPREKAGAPWRAGFLGRRGSRVAGFPGSWGFRGRRLGGKSSGRRGLRDGIPGIQGSPGAQGFQEVLGALRAESGGKGLWDAGVSRSGPLLGLRLWTIPSNFLLDLIERVQLPSIALLLSVRLAVSCSRRAGVVGVTMSTYPQLERLCAGRTMLEPEGGRRPPPSHALEEGSPDSPPWTTSSALHSTWPPAFWARQV